MQNIYAGFGPEAKDDWDFQYSEMDQPQIYRLQLMEAQASVLEGSICWGEKF